MSRSIDRVRQRAAIRRVEEVYGADIEDIIGALDLFAPAPVIGKLAWSAHRADVDNPDAVTVYWIAGEAMPTSSSARIAGETGVEPWQTANLVQQTFQSPRHVTVQGDITIGDRPAAARRHDTYRLTESNYQITQNYLRMDPTATPMLKLNPFIVTVDGQKVSRPVVMVDFYGITAKDIKWSTGYEAAALSRRASAGRASSHRPPVARSGGGVVAAIKRFFR